MSALYKLAGDLALNQGSLYEFITEVFCMKQTFLANVVGGSEEFSETWNKVAKSCKYNYL